MAKDRFHEVVKNALIKNGWNVTHDRLEIKVGGVDMEIDLGAERLWAAERGTEKIALLLSKAFWQVHRQFHSFIWHWGSLLTTGQRCAVKMPTAFFI